MAIVYPETSSATFDINGANDNHVKPNFYVFTPPDQRKVCFQLRLNMHVAEFMIPSGNFDVLDILFS